jgi:ADP-L-glycero-D-manno-heptose 6-epimerase
MYIITGGAGFIGSALIWKLNTQGIEDILVVDRLGESAKWKNLVHRKYRDYIHKNAFLETLAKDPYDKIDAIIHMGACSSTTEEDADYLMQNNFHYSVTLAEYALAKGIRFINASSAATYGDGKAGFSDDPNGLGTLRPLNMYGYSKHLFDLWAWRSGAVNRLASLKFFNVFGPNEYHKSAMSSLVFKGFFQIRETGCLRLFKSYHEAYADGEQQRDFIYVKDCADFIWWLLENPTTNGLYNLGCGQARSWNALARALFKAMQVDTCIEYIDMPEELKGKYQYFTQAETTKLIEAGYTIRFTMLEDAIRDYVVNYLQKEDPYL